jgi:TPR repeat protein
MRAEVKDLIVTLCGLATSALTAAVLAMIEIKAHFALYAFTFWLVIPVGACLSGFIASSGYTVGAKLLNHQLHRFFIINIIGVSIATYFLLNYMVYTHLTFNGQHISEMFSFGRYMDMVIQNRKTSFIGVGSFGKPGLLGYVQVAIQLVGFAAGGLTVYRKVASELYCRNCGRYVTVTWSAAKYNSVFGDVGVVYQQAKTALEAGNAASAVELFSKLSAVPSGTLRLNLRLGQCPKCLSEFYDLTMFFQDGKKWEPRPDFQRRGVVRQGLSTTAPVQSEPETIGFPRIAVTLGALAIPLAAIFLFGPAGLTDSSSQLREGARYLTGKDVPRDAARGAELLRKSAMGGNTVAMTTLGELYRDGKSVPRDPEAARTWLEKGANGGNSLAMFDLGLMYGKGQGIPRDPKQAAKWYQKAVEKGNVDAMINLGNLYSSGTGEMRSDQAARELFQKAAAAGRVAGLHNLGRLDLLGTPPNYAGAIIYFEQAAVRGYAQSMTTLGQLYTQGKGVPRD